MKKIALAMTPLLTIGLVSFTTWNAELPIGATLPKGEVKLKDITGKLISLKEATQKNGLLVMFSCNTCPYVVKNQDRTKEICSYALENNVGVIVINSNEAARDGGDSFAAMKEYAKTQGYQWSYVVDENSEIADAFGANRTPECFLFSKENKLVYHGAIDDNPQDAGAVNRRHLKEAVNEMVSGKPVSVQTTKSVGCGIKRKA